MARKLKSDAGDDALDLLDQLLGLLARADRAGNRERLRTPPTLDLTRSSGSSTLRVMRV